MAPERFSRNNLPIMANDIYSLGSTVYEMLSGYLPFGNDGGLLQKKGADVPEVPGDFSPLLKKTLEDCLQEEPWQRPTAEKLEEIANQALREPEIRTTVINESGQGPTTDERPVSEGLAETAHRRSRKHHAMPPLPASSSLFSSPSSSCSVVRTMNRLRTLSLIQRP